MFRRTLVQFSVAAPAVAAFAAPVAAADPIGRLISAMTLPAKVGQMFVSYVYGASATTTTAADVAANRSIFGADVDNGAVAVAKYHLGGIIYFTWSNNLANPAQIAELSNGLQRSALANGGIPLQISTDQEGGVVNRIGAPLAVSPGNMAIGATFHPASAFQAARVSGTELRALGINVVDAPVLDVNTNPLNSADGPRAFGDRTAGVSAFGVSALAGYAAAGIGAQAKHFPGLGDTTVNTDNGVAVTNQTRAQIMATHLPPFRAAIAAGVPSIMAAHIVAPALDESGRPASLSRPIVTGLLRRTLHYDGVVITDALDAAALAGIPADRIVLDAIEAGVDQLLMPKNVPAAIQTVLDAVASGAIPESRIDQSVRRILRMKGRLGEPYVPAPVVGTPEHLAVQADVARRSITELRNTALPLRAGQNLLVTGWGVSTTTNLANALAQRGLTATRLYTGSPSPALIARAVLAARAADLTVLTTYNVWADGTQRDLVAALLGTGKPIAVVSVGGPYDIAYFPAVGTYLAAYDYQPVSIAAVADVLAGRVRATGRLPVTIRTPDGSKVLFRYGV